VCGVEGENPNGFRLRWAFAFVAFRRNESARHAGGFSRANLSPVRGDIFVETTNKKSPSSVRSGIFRSYGGWAYFAVHLMQVTFHRATEPVRIAMMCRSFNHFPQKHADRFVPLLYQPKNNDIPVPTPPRVTLETLRTLAVSGKQRFGLRREAKRHAALPARDCFRIYMLLPSESGVAAALCHRTPNCSPSREIPIHPPSLRFGLHRISAQRVGASRRRFPARTLATIANLRLNLWT